MPRIAVPPSAASVAALRHELASDLLPIGSIDTISDATLVLSELLSNAVRHALPASDGGMIVNWHVEDVSDGQAVVIAVTDGSTETEPEKKPPSEGGVSGRGLAIVDTIATDWGVRRTPQHKTVWARVPLTHRLAHLQ